MQANADPVITHILRYLTEKPGATMESFFVDEQQFAVANTDVHSDFESIWRNKFKHASNLMELVPLPYGKPDWGALALAAVRAPREVTAHSHPIMSPAASPTTTTTIASNITEQPKKLNPVDLERVKAMYERMKEELMWTLSSGKKVEKQMKAAALAAPYEHPAHSGIFDATDAVWKEYFTPEELHEIKAYQQPPIVDLPAELQEFVNSFNGKDTLPDLYHHVRSFQYCPKQQPDLHWMQLSVEQALVLLYHDYLKAPRTEADIVKRVWPFLDSCFDSSASIVCNSGEKASKATSEGQNQGRGINATDAMTRKKVGVKVDLLFSTQRFDLGVMEAGVASDRSSTKSVVELCLKCPKSLKDMLVELERSNPSQLHSYKSCGFVVSGLYLQYVVLDCPVGYVCRVNKLPDWAEFPLSATEFAADFFKLLHLTWAAKQLMTDTKLAVEKKQANSTLSFMPPPSPRLLEPSFNHSCPKSNSKKRKSSTPIATSTPSPSTSASSSS